MGFIDNLGKKRKTRSRKEILKDLSLHYFYGNVRAHLGRIVTKEDVEIRKKKIADYVF